MPNICPTRCVIGLCTGSIDVWCRHIKWLLRFEYFTVCCYVKLEQGNTAKMHFDFCSSDFFVLQYKLCAHIITIVLPGGSLGHNSIQLSAKKVFWIE